MPRRGPAGPTPREAPMTPEMFYDMVLPRMVAMFAQNSADVPEHIPGAVYVRNTEWDDSESRALSWMQDRAELDSDDELADDTTAE